MARLTAAQANVKSLFNGEGVPSGSGLDPKDPFSYPVTFTSIKPHKRRSTRLYSSSSSSSSASSNKTKRLNAEVRLFFGDDEDVNGDNKGGDHAHHDGDDDDDEFERDELSCFRGLVLDISYRLVINPFVLFGHDYFPRSKGLLYGVFTMFGYCLSSTFGFLLTWFDSYFCYCC